MSSGVLDAARPLRVLLVTWNMGGAPPDATFAQCFSQDPECGLGAVLCCLRLVHLGCMAAVTTLATLACT